MNELEKVMADILTSLNVEWHAQYEVGRQFFSAKCHSKYHCQFQEGSPEEGVVYCTCDEDIALEECPWLQPSMGYPLYILDFAVFLGDAKICLECDGFYSHFNRKPYDATRDEYLRRDGWLVKRYAGTTIVSHTSRIKKELKDFFQPLLPKIQMELFDALPTKTT